jgi:predicted amidohydrolase YtcJ
VRQVQVGSAADLCLLDRPLSEALKTPYAVSVVATLVDGSPTHGLQIDGRGV